MPISWKSNLCVVYLLLEHGLAQYTVLPRWGQAVTLIDNALLVHGGKTDEFNSYSYASAPSNNDVLYLSLASSFDTSSIPWQLVSSSTNASTSQGPYLAWHTLSAFNDTEILLFGGELDPNSLTVLPATADSAFLLNASNLTDPLWITEPTSWANEPIRRMRHTTSSAGGMVYLVGGEKADGSNEAFSDHYVFDINIPSFTLLPSLNGPPDLSGHAAIVLANGSLIVFGGYCGSQTALLPLTTIWMMDTTQPTLQWSVLSASNTNVPSPRQAFAATPLSNGTILIHGGTDAVFQNVYSDGWMLDTTQNPMVWSEVAALSQLGTRLDHFAVTSGSQIIFGFGYMINGAAPAALQILDSSNGQWITTFSPATTTSTNTISGGPSQTSQSGNGNGGSHTSSSGPGPDTPGHSTDSETHSGLALGATFGTLGLLAGGLVVVYLVRRRRGEGNKRFQMLRQEYGDDGGSPHGDDAIPMIMNVQSSNPWWFPGLAFFGPAARRRTQADQARRDMLADEDTRQFWHYVPDASGSAWSLRSMSAMVGGRMRTGSRDPSTRSSLLTHWREKSDPFSDGGSLMNNDPGSPTAPLQSHSRRNQSYSSAFSYSDPFADPLMDKHGDYPYSDLGNLNDREMKSLPPLPHTQLPHLQTALPLSTGIQPLTPLTERSSRNTLTDSSLLQDHVASSFDATSHTSHGDKPADASAPSHPTIHPSPRPTEPMRRSDSWWARFSRTSLLDRRSSDARSHARRLNIRDPNPAPRLVAIEESTHSTPASRLGSHSQQDSQLYGMKHGQSSSSLQTARTADTVAIEKLGVMDVAQRVTSSYWTSTGISSTHEEQQFPGENDSSGPLSHRFVPEDTPTVLSPMEMASAESPPSSSQLSPPQTHNYSESSPRKVTLSGGAVASRVQAYERRLSQDQELSSPPTSPDARNTKRREEKPIDKIISVNYGLAPRPNLYVANPDHVHDTSSSS